MIILDSNLWVFGSLGRNDQAATLLGDIEQGDTVSAISAYMVQEVLNAFARTPSLSSAERDEVQTAFLTRMHQMTGLIEAPSSRDMTDAILTETRTDTYVNFIGQTLTIQPKDVPILILAYKHADREPTILTIDETFAECVPADYNHPAITIDYVAQ
jgi:predicted nucleic acid-binding protein